MQSSLLRLVVSFISLFKQFVVLSFAASRFAVRDGVAGAGVIARKAVYAVTFPTGATVNDFDVA